ncbi:uncharacterized protein METZ01_LOCUS73312 [marine metagenome]|uniref:Uncharacterized protein n=1 Tax=marine metagenome TaxID=408172 RepID=A0A381TYB3_9ZZZZ
MAGGERLRAVRCGHLHPQRWLVHWHQAESMNHAHRIDRPPLFNGVENQPELVAGHFLVGLIIDRGDRCIAFSPAYYAREANHRSHAVSYFAPLDQGGLVNCIN